ncbi:MAG: DNA translocase FtsK [Acidimicrobiales bacterium]
MVAHRAKGKGSRPAPRQTAPAHAPAPSLWRRHERDLWAVGLVLVGLLVALAEVRALGAVGHGVARGLSLALGLGRILVPVVLIGVGAAWGWGSAWVERSRLIWGTTLGVLGVCGLGDLVGGRPGLHADAAALGGAGGWLGVAVGGGLDHAVGLAGALLIVLAALVVTLIILTGVGLRTVVAATVTGVRTAVSRTARWWTGRATPSRRPPPTRAPVPSREASATANARDARADALDEAEVEVEGVPFDVAPVIAPADEEGAPDAVASPGGPRDAPPAAPLVISGPWDLPPADLLTRTRERGVDRAAIDDAGVELVNALAAHGVVTTLVRYTVGPTVTRYELELGPGVKVARVTSLNRDIAYAMATPDVRILAPIPGRSAIGVEVPNRHRTLVALGDLLATPEAQRATHPLDVPVGRDISGTTVVVNLGEMPHVLISGATGSGKSSCINALITSLVVRATPEQVRLLLVDPKRVELGHYSDLPHLLAPVVVDPKKAAGALAWAVKEMERRYDLLAESGARDIRGYQELVAAGWAPPPSARQLASEALEHATGLSSDAEPSRAENLPYIVIVVDELNDLMMVAARDVEESVVRIAQMARAVGIHLVLATQRPSVDVITGVIKANVPSRMAFAVSSLADSRVILDQAGAERLIGKGDMLLVTSSSNIARRLQSPWVGEDEVRRVVTFWRAQGGQRETVVALEAPPSSGGAGGGVDDDDAVLREARELVLRFQSGSTSMLQRKLRVGFARAGRLMDQLEQEGIVAPGDGSKARKVLVTLEEYQARSAQ